MSFYIYGRVSYFAFTAFSRPVNEDMELFGSDASKGRGADGGPRVGSCESARLTFVGGLLITGHARCHVATASQRNRMTD